MNGAIDNHEVYLHVRVVISVVLGLGLTRILSGIARFVEHPARQKLSIVHLFWVGSVLISTIHFWWWEFGLKQLPHWRFELYLFVLCYAFLFYLMACLLFPADLGGYDGYEDYFLSRRRWFFGLFLASFLFDWVDTTIKGPERLALLGPEYEVKIVICLLLSLIAALVRNRRFHLIFAVAYLVYYVDWILRAYDNIH